MNIKLIVAILILFTSIGIVSAEPTQVNTKYLEFDELYGVHRLTSDIYLKEPGKLVYVENYYGLDGNGKPKFYSSGRFYDGKVVGKVHLDIERPRDRFRTAYMLVEKVFIVDGIRSTTWIDLRQYGN